MTLSIFNKFDINDRSLKNQRIDIWQFPLHQEFSEAKSLLNEDELARANRYHFVRHQRRFTIARAMMRLIIAHYLNLQAKEIEFSYNSHGKPDIVNEPSLQFNLSHSGDLALLAIGNQFPLGIDLEFFSARPYEGIGEHIFSTKENKELQELSNMLKPLAFFHLWAQKEALIKACGLGLSYPTKQFDLPLLPPTNQQMDDPKLNQQWQIQSFMPHIACCAALCHHPNIQEVRYLSLAEAGLVMP